MPLSARTAMCAPPPHRTIYTAPVTATSSTPLLLLLHRLHFLATASSSTLFLLLLHRLHYSCYCFIDYTVPVTASSSTPLLLLLHRLHCSCYCFIVHTVPLPLHWLYRTQIFSHVMPLNHNSCKKQH
eukprot:364349-Chlamydomonas_euryale.AAC.7